jgi:CRP-like cAMP-binding protein
MKYPQLYTQYENFAPTPLDQWLKIEALMVPKTFKKGEAMVKPGDDVRYMGIILKGLFKIFYLDEKGKEFIKAFRSEYDVVGPYAELLQSIPSRLTIESMEDTEVLMIDYYEFIKLYDEHICFQNLGRKIAEEHYVIKDQREFGFLQLSAADQYKKFLQDFPHLKGRISQYHIASYLGITSVGLSRIVSKLENKEEE